MERLSRVYGALAFYLDRKHEIDRYLEETDRTFKASATPIEQADPLLWEKIQRARAKRGETRL